MLQRPSGKLHHKGSALRLVQRNQRTGPEFAGLHLSQTSRAVPTIHHFSEREST